MFNNNLTPYLNTIETHPSCIEIVQFIKNILFHLHNEKDKFYVGNVLNNLYTYLYNFIQIFNENRSNNDIINIE